MNKKINITNKEFNSIHKHTNKKSLKCFKLFLTNDNQVIMEIISIDNTLNWLRVLIKKLPFNVSKDVITISDKVFFINNK